MAEEAEVKFKILVLLIVFAMILAACGPSNTIWVGSYCLPSGTDCGHTVQGAGRVCDGSTSIGGVTYILKDCKVTVSDLMK